MIKKFLLSLFLGSLIFGPVFVNAETIGNELPYGFYMDNIYNTIDEKLNFENSVDGNWLYKQYSNGAKRAILWNNGRLYTYFYENQNSKYQGFFNKACKIYSETGTIEFQGPLCNNTSDYTEEILNEFYNLTNYNFTYTISPNFADRNYYSPTLCFYNAINKYYYCISLQFHDGGNLEIPNNTTNFSNYADSSLFDSSVDINITGQNIYCPTIKQVIDSYNSKGYSSGLCYTLGKIYDGSSFEDVPVQSIFDVFSGKDDYLNRYEGYVTYCKSSVYNPAVCSDYFSGNSLKYNIFAKIPDISMVGGGKLLYNYCQLYNYDLNSTTCVSSGVVPELGTEITNNDIVSSIGNGEYTIVSPVTNGTVFSDLSGSSFSGDIITNIQQLFGKFTSLFKQQSGNTSGILPLWILVPFIIIVLFKLFKK